MATGEIDQYSRYLSQRRFGSLDGLRCISILGVMWHHTAPSWIVENRLSALGGQGVALFFAISGFLITTLLLRERDRNGAIDLKAFYWRRSLRILPLYYGVLLLYIILVALFEKDSAVASEFFHNVKYFATYTSNLFVPLEGRVIFYFAWSLATEEQFYILWPPLLVLLGRIWRACIPLVLTLAACAITSLMGVKYLSKIPVPIVAGALLALLLHTPQGFRRIAQIFGQRWSSLVVALVLAMMMIEGSTSWYIVHLLFALLVVSCVIREDHWLAPLLTLAPVAYFGTISYGMYMLHMLGKHMSVKLLQVLKLPPEGVHIFFMTTLATVIIATLSFRYYESFFLRLKTRFER